MAVNAAVAADAAVTSAAAAATPDAAPAASAAPKGKGKSGAMKARAMKAKGVQKAMKAKAMKALRPKAMKATIAKVVVGDDSPKAMKATRAAKGTGRGGAKKAAKDPTTADPNAKAAKESKRGRLMGLIRSWQDGSRICTALDKSEPDAEDAAAKKRPAAAHASVPVAPGSARRDRNANTGYEKMKRDGMIPEHVQHMMDKVMFVTKPVARNP